MKWLMVVMVTMLAVALIALIAPRLFRGRRRRDAGDPRRGFTMKYSAVALNLLLIPLLACGVVIETACNAQSFDSIVAKIDAELPAAETAVGTVLSIVDPAAAPLVAAFTPILNADFAAVKDAVAAYKAAPGATTQQKIEAAVDAVVNTVNAKLLELNGMKSPAATTVAGALSMVASIFAVIDGFIISAQSKAQAQAHAAVHQAKLEQVLPLLNRKQLEESARLEGVPLDRVLRFEMARGF